MRLFIAEKPSLARAIAQALPPPQRRYRDHLECGEGNVVAWCTGHILEPAMPEHYDRSYARWSLDHLPIVPRQWRLRASVPALVSVIKMLLRGARRVVHAGDPDREGQLLVDEVIEFLGYTGPVDRILIRDTNLDAVQRQLAALEPNDRYRPLGQAALARQRADWLYGLNMTRLYTLLGRSAGYDGRVLSIGRVQTPVLGLVAARDAAIEAFRPEPYFVVTADVLTEAGEPFSARWEAQGLQAPDVDGGGRVVREELAREVAARAAGARGRVTNAERETKVEPVPLPYSLADLQIDAARRIGLSAQAVLDACQALYETHRLTTYPRSDCAFLPEGHFGEGKEVLAAIARAAPDLAGLVAGADLSLRSRAWNDGKVTAHHAIVPTRASERAGAVLSSNERAVYDLIARRYICQFLAPHEYAVTRIELAVGSERFVAVGRETRCEGWRAAFPPAAAAVEEREEHALPAMRQGDAVALAQVHASLHKTQPPKAFTDASLMQAMVNIAAHVSDPRVKAILAEADGLGTPATRPGIIELLFERGFLERKGRAIVATPIGRALVGSLPKAAATADMTAEWEAAMRAVADGTLTVDAFVAEAASQLGVLIADAKAARPLPPPPPPAQTQPTAKARAQRQRASVAPKSRRT